MLLPIPDAIDLIFKNLSSLKVEKIKVEDALHRVIAEDIVSEIEMPPFDKSAVDGYAVKIKDTPGNLKVAYTVQAGDLPDTPLEDGEAVLVMTGAPIPKGTEAVVMREHTEEKGDSVEIPKKAKLGDNIAYKGEDIKKGETIIKKGTYITFAIISLLATLGIRYVSVKKLPSVSIMVTGSELVEPGERKIERGYIYNANAYSLHAMCRELGISPSYKGIIPDNMNALISALKETEPYDITLISGGVSMGDYDYVRDAILKIGGEIVFHRVAIKPGKPFLFAKKGDRLIFGMPGNPVSVMVIFQKFIAPAILRMQGVKDVFLLRIPAVFKGSYGKKTDRPHYIGVKVENEDGILYATHIESHGSADVPAFSKADGMIEVPKEKTVLENGEEIEIIPIGLIRKEYER